MGSAAVTFTLIDRAAIAETSSDIINKAVIRLGFLKKYASCIVPSLKRMNFLHGCFIQDGI